jgi:hypothetical protein
MGQGMSTVGGGDIIEASDNNDFETRVGLLEAMGASVLNTTSGGGSTTSSSYVDLPSSSVTTVAKASDSTRLLVYLRATFWSSGTSTQAQFGVQAAGTDYDVGYMYQDTANIRLAASGIRVLSGIAAGNVTVQGRWKRPSGTGTLNMTTTDHINIVAIEIP